MERTLAGAKIPTTADSSVRGMMIEFAQGPLVAGLYDIWTGTDVDLMILQMNDNFVEYARRKSRRSQPRDESREIRARLDPIVDADKWTTRVVTGKDAGIRARDFGFREALAIESCGAQCRASGPIARALYDRTDRDQAAVVHLMARDDEADDIGFVPGRDVAQIPVGGCAGKRALDAKIAEHERTIVAPRASDEEVAWDEDSSQTSARATPYHMAVLESQMSVLNERGACQCARPRVGGFIPMSGNDPAQSRRGRVTLDDSRWLARDIFARDSKGCMIKGYHELPAPFTCR